MKTQTVSVFCIIGCLSAASNVIAFSKDSDTESLQGKEFDNGSNQDFGNGDWSGQNTDSGAQDEYCDTVKCCKKTFASGERGSCKKCIKNSRIFDLSTNSCSDSASDSQPHIGTGRALIASILLVQAMW